MKYILEIGRFEDIALAEMKSVLGEDALKYLSGRYLYVETDKVLDQSWIDGVGSIIGVFEVVSVAKEEIGKKKVVDSFMQISDETVFGKGHIFFESNYLQYQDRRKVLTESKKLMSKSNIKVKYRFNWSTAAIWQDGWPENIVALKALKFRSEYFLLKLIAVQDINAYSKRDAGKPYRDAVLGMLPPKLSQTMINVGLDGRTVEDVLVMDPFCGTGTVLIEGQLKGIKVRGSDIQQRNVDGTVKNMSKFFDGPFDVFKADARSLSEEAVGDVGLFVTEGYLGVPKRGHEPIEDMKKESKEIERLALDFLRNLKDKKSNESYVVVMCLPVYAIGKRGDKIFMKKIVEKVEDLGYIVSTLLPAKLIRGNKDKCSLLYGRSDQYVYRQIYRLEYNPG
jgi:tRNA G10  N-methylase Trm11